MNQSTPNLAFNSAAVISQQHEINGGSTASGATPAGFRRIPMTGGHTLSQYNDKISQDTAAAWEQIDLLQQQFEIDMQNMLTPRVTDDMERDRFHFSHDTLNLDNSLTSSSSLSSLQVPPPVGVKPPKVAPKTNPKSTQHMSSFESVKSTSHHSLKRRPSIPDNDPKKPQLKKGKYPKTVWVQTSRNKAIESSSDSESDSDMSVDTVVAGPAHDTESLKSSHV